MLIEHRGSLFPRKLKHPSRCSSELTRAQIGELILLDGTLDRNAQAGSRSRNSIDSETYQDESGIDLSSPTPKSRSRLAAREDESQPSTLTNTPYQSALASASGSTVSLSHPGEADDSFQSVDRQPGGEDLTPYVVQQPQIPASSSTVILRHADEPSDDEDEADMQNLSFGLDPRSAEVSPSPRRRRGASPNPPAGGDGSGGGGTADKAGVILGIFNVFIVMPQFVITALSSVIFHIMEPPTDVSPKHPHAIPIGNATVPADAMEGLARLVVREGAPVEGGSPDAVGLIFR